MTTTRNKTLNNCVNKVYLNVVTYLYNYLYLQQKYFIRRLVLKCTVQGLNKLECDVTVLSVTSTAHMIDSVSLQYQSNKTDNVR